jgi:membrane-associated protease RseP (regulator of RpoE activity)
MKKLPLIQITLFALTFVTTLGAGALQQGSDIFEDPSGIIQGFPFAGTLMLILLIHELAHYIASRIHRVDATLPYFIPAPNLLGTFGAFIKMKSPIVTRGALIDIGASGPIAGFLVSLLASVTGLYLSDIAPAAHAEGTLILGDSLLFSMLTGLTVGIVPDNFDIVLHPIAFAGWIGMFVTTLNLIPVGQLDGGHIAYAFLGERSRILSIAIVAVLVVMGIFLWEGWAFWAVLLLIMKIQHPPVYYWEQPLDRRRRLAGIVSLIIFIITFVPAPFSVNF